MLINYMWTERYKLRVMLSISLRPGWLGHSIRQGTQEEVGCSILAEKSEHETDFGIISI